MRLRRTVFVIVAAVVLLSLTVIGSGASSSCVIDNAGLFTAEEIASIDATATAVGEKYGLTYYVVTTRERYWGDDLIRDLGLDKNDDMIFLIISDYPYETQVYYDMYYYGMAEKRISEGEVDDILDDPVVYGIKRGNYAEGVERFIELSGEATRVPWLSITFVALLIGTVVGIIIAVNVNSSYKKKLQSESYPLDRYAKLKLTDKNDKFAGKRVATMVVSGGGPRGGHGGGFGGGHGGGGGHAGGR